VAINSAAGRIVPLGLLAAPGLLLIDRSSAVARF
jgi:hypothetical protein